MRAYVLQRHNTVAQYIATRPIMELYENTVRKPGAWVDSRWWEHGVLDLAVSIETTTAAADGGEGKEGKRRSGRW